MKSKRRELRKFIIFLLCLALSISIFGCGRDSAASKQDEITEEETSAEEETTAYIPADLSAYEDLIMPLTGDGYSEFVGPWAYDFYAKDENTSFTYHEAGDGYVPQAGDLIITGDDDDLLYIDRRSKKEITGLGRFDYWFDDYAWNGHILYVISEKDGILTCCEGNSIAPYQDLDIDDPDYIYKSSVDMIQIDFASGETLTEGKTPAKQIRAVIETSFPEELTLGIAWNAGRILNEFENDPDAVRAEIMALYPGDIDWCGLFIHYLFLRTVE